MQRRVEGRDFVRVCNRHNEDSIQNLNKSAKFEVITAVLPKIQVFRVVTACQLVNIY
jgi:hypothetical protein